MSASLGAGSITSRVNSRPARAAHSIEEQPDHLSDCHLGGGRVRQRALKASSQVRRTPNWVSLYVIDRREDALWNTLWSHELRFSTSQLLPTPTTRRKAYGIRTNLTLPEYGRVLFVISTVGIRVNETPSLEAKYLFFWHKMKFLKVKIKKTLSGSSIPVSGVKLERGYYLFWLFFKIDLCSATSIGSSRQDLLNDVAENRFILKNNQNTHNARFSFTL